MGDKINKFKVLDEGGNEKYEGAIYGKEPHEKDNCSCPSRLYGMKFDRIENEYKGESDYLREHGYSYQCKHIIAAKNKRFEVQI